MNYPLLVLIFAVVFMPLIVAAVLRQQGNPHWKLVVGISVGISVLFGIVVLLSFLYAKNVLK